MSHSDCAAIYFHTCILQTVTQMSAPVHNMQCELV